MTKDFSEHAPKGEMAPEQLAQAAKALASGTASIAIGRDAPNATVNTFHLTFGGASRPLTEDALAALGEWVRKRLPRVLNNLPPVATAFAGRETEENEIFAQFARGGGAAAISALRGIGGVGKTALAVKIAHRLTPLFPAAQILVDLRGTGEAPVTPRAAMEDVFLRFYPDAKPPDDESKLGEVYRDLLKRNKCLLILDNARDAAQVSPLLPPPPSGALVTSRRTLDCAEIKTTRLEDLPIEDAKKLILDLVTGERALGAEELTELAERACCRHPLSLKVAALFLRGRKGQSVKVYVERVVRERERLRIDGLPDHDVMAVLGQSVRQLARDKPELFEAWRRLCVFPADFGTDAAAAVWESEDRDQACDDLNLLESFGLIEVLREERYKLHDLLRDLARKDFSDDHFEAAALRHAQYFEATLARANDLYLQGRESVLQGLALFDLERANIVAGQSWAAQRIASSEQAAILAARYANAGVYVLNLRLAPRDQIVWLTAQLDDCRRTGDRRGEGNALGNLGLAYAALCETRKAIDYFDQSLTVAREIGDRRDEGNAMGNFGLAYARLGETRKAIDYYEKRLTIACEIGDRRGEGNALGGLGNAYARLGETRKAIDYHEKRLIISREIGDRRGEGNGLGNLGVAYAALDETRKAIDYFEKAQIVSREIGDRRGEGGGLGNLGNAYAILGEARKAIEYFQQQLSIAREVGDRAGEGRVLANMGLVLASDDPARARACSRQALEILTAIEDPHAKRVEQWLRELDSQP